jgi:uncharacterized Zn finger protein
MDELTLIHCKNCGRDGVADVIHQHSEKSIKRCGSCHSLHYKVLDTIPVPVEQPVEYSHLAEVVQGKAEEA